MSYNDFLHDFGVNKANKLQRSKELIKHKTITTMAQGVLTPLHTIEVVPNSKQKIDLANFTRLALTPTHPFFGDMFITLSAFYVPYRILNKNFTKMFGDATPNEWTSNNIEYVIPYTNFYTASSTPVAASAGYDAVVNTCVDSSGRITPQIGNLADYLGFPIKKNTSAATIPVNPMAFVAYEKIWSDFWRDENFQNPDPDVARYYELSGGSYTNSNYRFCLHYANRMHDYFTSVLPDTQKGGVSSMFAPIDTQTVLTDFTGGAMRLSNDSVETISGNLQVSNTTVQAAGSAASGGSNIYASNLGASITITELRNAFALQRAKERNARSGSRYQEALLGAFESQVPMLLDKPEYLGGVTIPLNLSGVPQTGSDAGKLGAFSATRESSCLYIKDLAEPGLVMILGVIRSEHNYSQGLDKKFLRLRRYEYYDPAFAHISEQPILAIEKDISVNNTTTKIGFNEPWADYRKPVHKITGYLRSSDLDMKSWAIQDNETVYTPYGYFPENTNTIAACTKDANASMPMYQFIVESEAIETVTRPMPIYSIPGMVDHLIA
ncbi:major capsid protein [Capybara microvirus Cap1_SP_142]|nr:major capsid protein [Capybara microvirus Cap1_SP_142]